MFDLSTPEALKALREQVAQSTAVAVAKPHHPAAQQRPGKVKVASAKTDRPVSEQDAIEFVQRYKDEKSQQQILSDLRFAAEDLGSDVPDSKLVQIVDQYAPKAPVQKDISEPAPETELPPYPAELTPLIESGVAFVRNDHWYVKRCVKCGQFKTNCCGSVNDESAVREDETLTGYGRQAVGLDSIKTPTPKLAKTSEQIVVEWTKEPWWHDFRSVGELQGNGSVKMYIENFLPEGITLITGLPKEGKSWLALSVAKALTSQKPLFGRNEFKVPESVPVLYLAAESGDGALKLRCEKFGIIDDKTKFITRTLSQGSMIGLQDPKLEKLIKAMRPIVILETLIRFNDGDDENDSTENKKLADNLFQLLGWGARAVLGIHHSRKDVKSNPTKEYAVRGSSDGLAMVDAAWLVMQDEKKYHKHGLIEIDVMGWGRDFTPNLMRLALTKTAPDPLPPGVTLFSPGVVSCIDMAGDLEWIERKIVFEPKPEHIEKLILDTPTITIEQIAKQTGGSQWDIRKIIKALGYTRPPGGKKNSTEWTKPESGDDS